MRRIAAVAAVVAVVGLLAGPVTAVPMGTCTGSGVDLDGDGLIGAGDFLDFDAIDIKAGGPTDGRATHPNGTVEQVGRVSQGGAATASFQVQYSTDGTYTGEFVAAGSGAVKASCTVTVIGGVVV